MRYQTVPRPISLTSFRPGGVHVVIEPTSVGRRAIASEEKSAIPVEEKRPAKKSGRVPVARLPETKARRHVDSRISFRLMTTQNILRRQNCFSGTPRLPTDRQRIRTRVKHADRPCGTRMLRLECLTTVEERSSDSYAAATRVHTRTTPTGITVVPRPPCPPTSAPRVYVYVEARIRFDCNTRGDKNGGTTADLFPSFTLFFNGLVLFILGS